MDKDQLQQRLMATFKIEANEHLQSILTGLLQLEKNPPKKEYDIIIETIHREAHSLKGAARAVNLLEIETLCQSIEKIFLAWKRNELKLLPDHYDVLHKSFNSIKMACASSDNINEILDRNNVSKMVSQLNAVFQVDAASSAGEQPAQINSEKSQNLSDSIASSQTVRIESARLDSLLFKIEEMLTVKLIMQKYSNEFKSLNEYMKIWKSDWHKQLKGKSTKSTEAFMTNGWDKIKSIEGILSSLHAQFNTSDYQVSILIDNLLNDTKNMVMLPFSSLIDSLEIMVRNISREQGKKINFIMKGTDIEIDKRILDELKTPLIHIVRNSIDHGIERPEHRNSKHPTGMIKISISQSSGNEVEVTITDDGCGININSVKNSALKLGKITQHEAQTLPDDEALSLIYMSGISTSPVITNVSGNGLGMTIAHEKIEKIGGHIAIKSEENTGTEFKITLPLSLSTFKGIIIKSSDYSFVLPTVYLERIIRIRLDDIKTIENREAILLDSVSISLIKFNELLGIADNIDENLNKTYFPVIIIRVGEHRAAFMVDKIQSEQDVIVKKLNKPLLRVKFISAVTILESGCPVPILNVTDMIKAVVKDLLPKHAVSNIENKLLPETKSILIVEDSITTRMLLKNILEMANFNVITAVDGADAWCILKENDINLVLSDIDMPRMDGLTLTRHIRSDQALASLPVILVTTHDKQEDRESGFEAGANAYIVKSNFDDNNLISVIKRLI